MHYSTQVDQLVSWKWWWCKLCKTFRMSTLMLMVLLLLLLPLYLLWPSFCCHCDPIHPACDECSCRRDGRYGMYPVNHWIASWLSWIRILRENIFYNYCLCSSENQKRGTNVGVNAVQAPLPGSASFCIDTPKEVWTVNCSLGSNTFHPWRRVFNVSCFSIHLLSV